MVKVNIRVIQPTSIVSALGENATFSWNANRLSQVEELRAVVAENIEIEGERIR
jgi:hypothetical protein